MTTKRTSPDPAPLAPVPPKTRPNAVPLLRPRRGAVGAAARTRKDASHLRDVTPSTRRAKGAKAPAAPAEPADPRAEETARLRAIVGNVDVRLALELDGQIDHCLGEFERTNGALVRKTCSVPGVELDDRGLVHAAVLGHILSRMERAQGRLQVEKLVATLLEQFETARQQIGALTRPSK